MRDSDHHKGAGAAVSESFQRAQQLERENERLEAAKDSALAGREAALRKTREVEQELRLMRESLSWRATSWLRAWEKAWAPPPAPGAELSEPADWAARKAAIRDKAAQPDARFNIAIKIAAPEDVKARWGDFHYAESLADAFRTLGHEVRIDLRHQWHGEGADEDEIVLVLRGLKEYVPEARHLNVLWNISHPDQIAYDEYERFDLVYVASNTYAAFLRPLVKPPVLPLLQATDTQRFNLAAAGGVERDIPLLFIGNTRGKFRPIVRWAMEQKLELSIYGDGWERFFPSRMVKARNVDNREVASLYARSKVVLNDHWESMRECGLLSNRLFDALACGATVVSDLVPSTSVVFDGAVREITGPDELRRAVTELQDDATRRHTAEMIAREHSFDARAGQIIDDLRRYLGSDATEDRLVPAAPAVRGRAIPGVTLIAPHREASQATRDRFYRRLLSPLTSEALAAELAVSICATDDVAGIDAAALVIAQRSTLADPKIAVRLLSDHTGMLVVEDDQPGRPLDETEAAAREADLLWVESEPAAAAHAELVIPTAVIPEGLDPRIWRDFRSPRPTIGGNSKVRFIYLERGYQNPDLRFLVDAIGELNEKRRGSVELTVIGHAGGGSNRRWIQNVEPPADAQDYPRYVRWLIGLPSFDIGIGSFSDSAIDSDRRHLEHSALGVLSLLPVAPAKTFQTEDWNGAVVLKPEHDWRGTLQSLRVDPSRDAYAVETAWQELWRTRSAGCAGLVQLRSLQALL